jgi:hypothetical protein
MASVHQEVFDQALVSVAQSLGALRPTPVAKLQLLFSPLPALVDAGNNSIRSLNHDQLSSLSQLDFEQQKTIITTFLVCTAHSPTIDTNLIVFFWCVCFRLIANEQQRWHWASISMPVAVNTPS